MSPPTMPPQSIFINRVSGVSITASHDDPRVISALEKYLALCEHAEPPDRHAFLAKYPEIAAVLGPCLDGLALVQAAVPGVSGVCTAAVNLALLPSYAGRSTDPEGPGPFPEPLGDYRIIRELGRGGMGIVYEAEQLSLARRVALKVLPFASMLDPRHLQRFKNEALAAAHLDHPNIVEVYGVGCERGIHFYAMRYVEGQTLAAVIEQMRNDECGMRNEFSLAPSPRSSAAADHSPFGIPHSPFVETAAIAALSTLRTERPKDFFRTIAHLGIQAAEALDHAHQMGIVHRDIKPSNLMIECRHLAPRDGANPSPSGRGQGEGALNPEPRTVNPPKLYITDFGLAHIESGATLTMTGDLLGTLRYMSPEQAEGRSAILDHRTDIYSLGVTFYELLTLRPAFPADDRQTLLKQIANEEPTPPRHINSVIPSDLETIILKASQKDPLDRYSTAGSFADDLRRFLAHKTITASRPSPWRRAQRWCRRHKTLAAALLTILVLAVVGALAAALIIQRLETRRLTQIATAQRNLEIERAVNVRRPQYAANLRLAYDAWGRGEFETARQALSKDRPDTGVPDIRGFEWHYLWRLCRDEVSSAHWIQQAHKGDAYFVTYSPDGHWIATAGADDAIRLWDASSGMLNSTIEPGRGDANCLAFSPDGTIIASVHDDGTVVLTDWSSGKERAVLGKHKDWAVQVAYSSNAEWIASSSRDNTVKLWNAKTLEEKATLTGTAIAISPDSKTLIASNNAPPYELNFWTLPELERRSWNHGYGPLRCVQFSKDGYFFAMAPGGPGIVLSTISSPGAHFSLRPHDVTVEWFALALDRGWVASAGDRTVRLTQKISNFPWQLPMGHRRRSWCVAISPVADTIASTGDEGCLKVWKWDRPPAAETVFESTERMFGMALPEDGTTLGTLSETGEISLWDVSSRQNLARVSTASTKPAFSGLQINHLAFSNNGSRLVYSAALAEVVLWDVRAQREERRVAGEPSGWGMAWALSADGRILATCGFAEQQITLWDCQSGQPVRTMPRGDMVTILAFSPDASALIVGCNLGPVLKFDVASGTPLPFRGEHSHRVTAAAFSSDAKSLCTASSDGICNVWDSDGIMRASLVGHRASIYSVAVSPDAKTIATAGEDGTIRLWSLATGDELLVFDVLHPASWVKFSPDGESLFASRNVHGRHTQVYKWSIK